MLRSENARLAGWVYVDIRGRDLALGGARRAARRRARSVKLPPGVSLAWSGQFEYLERATKRLDGRRAVHAARSSSCCSTSRSGASTRRRCIMVTLPFALVGGFWLL